MSSNANLYKKITLPAASQPDNMGEKKYKGFSTVNTNTENFSLYEMKRTDLVDPQFIKFIKEI